MSGKVENGSHIPRPYCAEPYREEWPILIEEISPKQKENIDYLARQLQALTPDNFLGSLFDYVRQQKEAQRQRDLLRERHVRPLSLKIRQMIQAFPIF